MGDTSLAEINSAHLNERAARLDKAITTALASKVPAPPKAQKATKPSTSPASSSPVSSTAAGTAGTVTPASTASSAPVSSASGDSSGAAQPPVEAEALADDAQVEGEGEPQDGAAEAEETAIDRKAIEAAAKKKDLRAIEKALGLPEGVLGATNGEYAALRRRDDEVTARAQAVEQQHVANQQALIDKFGPHWQLGELAKKGDLRAYAGLIERTTGIPVGKFIALYSQNVQQMNPRELELERENTRLRLLAEGKDKPPPAAQETPAAAPDAAAAVQKANEYLTAEAKDHPALKLKGGLDDVRAKWLQSFDPKTRAWKLTPKQAADAVVAERKTQLEQEQWILSGKKPAKKPTTRAVPRTGSSETQPRGQLSNDPAIRRQQAIEIHAAQIRRQKAAERARSGG